MRRRCLVLGGTGFLGVHVLRAARAAGLETWCAARQPSPLAGPAFQALDAEDSGALGPLLAELAPVCVVNCIALARVSDCERAPERARALNAEFPGRLARLARARGIRLVHVSTDLVFGDRPAPPAGFAEDDEPGPVSAYGATKLAGERAVLAAEPRALVARLPLLCGASFGRELGASDAVVAAVRRGERPRLFTDEVRTPLDAADAARALVELAARDLAGRLHLAGPERLTRLELGLRALAAAGCADPRAQVDAAVRAGEHARRPADVALDSARARRLLVSPLPAPGTPRAGP
ncbi:MAG: sugar nucleotide-binding protein [Planctomycetes bacterium]|nr:sugar nucleotide-binding protein [Planctomycetota bacterium]